MSSPHVHHADDATFDAEVLASPLPVLVDFTATWCGPCKALAPIVARIADDGVGRVKVVEVDLDDAPGVAKRFGIRGAPTLLVFRGGAKVAQHVGLTSRAKIEALLEA